MKGNISFHQLILVKPWHTSVKTDHEQSSTRVSSHLWITAICWTNWDLHLSVSKIQRDWLRGVSTIHCNFNVFIWHLRKQRHSITIKGDNTWGQKTTTGSGISDIVMMFVDFCKWCYSHIYFSLFFIFIFFTDCINANPAINLKQWQTKTV